MDLFNKDSKECEKQLYVVMQLVLREYIAMYTLDELLDKKETITDVILTHIADKANLIGIEVVSCGIRDVILPGDVKEIMNQVLIAEKQAQANSIIPFTTSYGYLLRPLFRFYCP